MNGSSDERNGASAALSISRAPAKVEIVRAGATHEELMEAIWVAAEMRAGAAYAHSAISLATMDKADRLKGG